MPTGLTPASRILSPLLPLSLRTPTSPCRSLLLFRGPSWTHTASLCLCNRPASGLRGGRSLLVRGVTLRSGHVDWSATWCCCLCRPGGGAPTCSPGEGGDSTDADSCPCVTTTRRARSIVKAGPSTFHVSNSQPGRARPGARG